MVLYRGGPSLLLFIYHETINATPLPFTHHISNALHNGVHAWHAITVETWYTVLDVVNADTLTCAEVSGRSVDGAVHSNVYVYTLYVVIVGTPCNEPRVEGVWSNRGVDASSDLSNDHRSEKKCMCFLHGDVTSSSNHLTRDINCMWDLQTWKIV